MFDITISIVAYKSDINQLKKVLNSCFDTDLNIKVYVVDNFPLEEIKKICNDKNAEYIPSYKNIGFGAAHNIVMKKTLEISKYHLILNPDVYFDKGTLETIYQFMENNFDVGHLMPKILYPDGSIQYLCKLLPTPFDLIFRKFLPFRKYIEKRNEIYELKFSKYSKMMNVPYLSGCFMFIRTSVLKEIGLFYEKIFMYGEDIDLTRRIHKRYKTIFYPYAAVYHQYQKESYKRIGMLLIHIKSAITYFNKWGWFFDKDRDIINARVLEKLHLL